MRNLTLGLAATLAVAGVAQQADATALLNGSSGVVLSVFNTATQGTLIASMVTGPASAPVGATFAATFSTAVYMNTLGTLDFYYQVMTNSIDAGDEINGITGFNFAGYTIDAQYFTGDIDGAGTTFAAANNPNSDGPNGTSLGFTSTGSRNNSGATPRIDFGNNGLEAAGERSATYIFRTNATNYKVGNFTATDGSTVTTSAFAPTTGVVPEPASWALMLAGFGLMGYSMRSSRRKVAVNFG